MGEGEAEVMVDVQSDEGEFPRRRTDGGKDGGVQRGNGRETSSSSVARCGGVGPQPR